MQQAQGASPCRGYACSLPTSQPEPPAPFSQNASEPRRFEQALRVEARGILTESLVSIGKKRKKKNARQKSKLSIHTGEGAGNGTHTHYVTRLRKRTCSRQLFQVRNSNSEFQSKYLTPSQCMLVQKWVCVHYACLIHEYRLYADDDLALAYSVYAV